MREPARLQAAIELVDAVIEAVRTEGAAADTLIQRYFATRRYAGSRDRAAVRAYVYAALRFTADMPASGRAAFLGLAEQEHPELLSLFDGSAHAPLPPQADEPRATPSLLPAWLVPAFRQRFGDRFEVEARALMERAPLDLRINALHTTDVATITAQIPNAVPIDGLPLGLRLMKPVALDMHPLLRQGVVEIQDAASQYCVQLADARPHQKVIDLCAGAGGKTLALAASMRGQGYILATDIDRQRLSAMTPRLANSGAANMISRRLLDPGKEREMLADVAGQADLVLVDAPCSGTGTWRRNPELRWRLTPERLQRFVQIQRRLLQLASELVKPGGRVVYSVCSVLDAEGGAQADHAIEQFGWTEEARAELSPATHGCDGFFVARLATVC